MTTHGCNMFDHLAQHFNEAAIRARIAYDGACGEVGQFIHENCGLLLAATGIAAAGARATFGEGSIGHVGAFGLAVCILRIVTQQAAVADKHPALKWLHENRDPIFYGCTALTGVYLALTSQGSPLMSLSGLCIAGASVASTAGREGLAARGFLAATAAQVTDGVMGSAGGGPLDPNLGPNMIYALMPFFLAISDGVQARNCEVASTRRARNSHRRGRRSATAFAAHVHSPQRRRRSSASSPPPDSPAAACAVGVCPGAA